MQSGAVVAELPAGSESDDRSVVLPTKNGSLPATTPAAPVSVQPLRVDSRSPPGASVYLPASLHGRNGCLSAGCGTQPCGLAAVVAACAAGAATSMATAERPASRRPVRRELVGMKGILT